ncbi:DUF2213 domain-containing protein [Brevundimonas sp. GCM10030266]|uniref:DUF2213 domain-containing protein n=1 Tax=Brevundimonas sp. GCM10030266 TaxID=3273386 RepID=UPI0036232641
MIIKDSLTLDASGLKLTRDGFLVGEARVSRAGNVQQYLGRELGLTGDAAAKSFGVYRDPDVVFDSASMMSLAGRPVTRNHPKDAVTAANWKDLAVGQVGGVIRRDGEHVVAPMAIMDATAAKEVHDGARCLSAGYTVDVVPAEGIAPDGTPYQFKQAGELRFNHVAYLPDNNPRAGNTRIGDDRIEDRGTPDAHRPPLNHGDRRMTLKTIIVDGLPVETTDAGEAAINLLKSKLADAGAVLQTAKTDHAKAIEAKDAELAKKDAEIDDLKTKVIDGPALDKMAAERADVVTKAKALDAKVVTDGKTNGEIKRAVLGDAAKDKSDAYVDAAFDLKTADVKPGDPLRKAITDSAPAGGGVQAASIRDAARLASLN